MFTSYPLNSSEQGPEHWNLNIRKLSNSEGDTDRAGLDGRDTVPHIHEALSQQGHFGHRRFLPHSQPLEPKLHPGSCFTKLQRLQLSGSFPRLVQRQIWFWGFKKKVCHQVFFCIQVASSFTPSHGGGRGEVVQPWAPFCFVP